MFFLFIVAIEVAKKLHGINNSVETIAKNQTDKIIVARGKKHGHQCGKKSLCVVYRWMSSIATMTNPIEKNRFHYLMRHILRSQ